MDATGQRITDAQGSPAQPDTAGQVLLDQAVGAWSKYLYTRRQLTRAEQAVHGAVAVLSPDLRGRYAEVTERMAHEEDLREMELQERRDRPAGRC